MLVILIFSNYLKRVQLAKKKINAIAHSESLRRGVSETSFHIVEHFQNKPKMLKYILQYRVFPNRGFLGHMSFYKFEI